MPAVAIEIKEYKGLTRWCSHCGKTRPHRVTDTKKSTDKFWKGCVQVTSDCGGCGRTVVDFYKPAELDEMEATNVIRE